MTKRYEQSHIASLKLSVQDVFYLFWQLFVWCITWTIILALVLISDYKTTQLIVYSIPNHVTKPNLKLTYTECRGC